MGTSHRARRNSVRTLRPSLSSLTSMSYKATIAREVVHLECRIAHYRLSNYPRICLVFELSQLRHFPYPNLDSIQISINL